MGWGSTRLRPALQLEGDHRLAGLVMIGETEVLLEDVQEGPRRYP